MNIENCMENFLSAMEQEGYPKKTIRSYRNPITCLINFCKIDNDGVLDATMVERFIDYHVNRYKKGAISKATIDYYSRPAKYFYNYIETGAIHPIRKYTPQHCDPFESIINDIRTNTFFNSPDRAHMISTANIFFSWLEKNGCFSSLDIKLEHIRGFMLERSNKVIGRTLYGDQRRLKALNNYMIAQGLMKTDFSEYLSFPIIIEKKILPAMSMEDICKLLLSIDRNTPDGKKDYAIILLAAVTGMRAIDIVSLERSNIDWVNGEIRINQSKTGKSVALPLTRDVGEAIKDYILEARPKSTSLKIFVHHRAPYAAYNNSTAISERFNHLCKNANIECKGFHSLRRSVGQRMAIAEIPLTTISQLLGHSGVDVTKQYIFLDSTHLSICALSFDGIKPGGGIYA